MQKNREKIEKSKIIKYKNKLIANRMLSKNEFHRIIFSKG